MVIARDFLAELENELHQPGRYLPDHPFVTGVEQGTLTREQLRGWTLQTFPIYGLSLRFLNLPTPGIEMIAEDAEFKQMLWENKVEELYGAISETAGHTELFLRFAGALGLKRQEMMTVKRAPELNDLLQFMERMRREAPLVVSQTVIGTGLESQVPTSFRKIVDGLQRHYGLRDDQIEFFTVHIYADEEHGDVSARIVEKYITTEEMRQQTRNLTLQALDKFWTAWNVWQRY